MDQTWQGWSVVKPNYHRCAALSYPVPPRVDDRRDDLQRKNQQLQQDHQNLANLTYKQ